MNGISSPLRLISGRWLALAAAAATCFCAVSCSDLVAAWQYSPLDRLGWLALLLWSLPLLHLTIKRDPRLIPSPSRIPLFVLAIGLSVFGRLASFHFVQHLGLAVALMGWLGLRWTVLLWGAAAISWMPAFSWLASKVMPTSMMLLGRIILAGLGASTLINYQSDERRLLTIGRAGWIAFGALLAVSVLWQFIPLRGAEERLAELSISGADYHSAGVSLTPTETKSLGSALAIRRLYTFGAHRVIATVVDATHDRHAIHDPLYCFTGSGWTKVNDHAINIPGGQARRVQFARRGRRADLTYWFSDGQKRHADIRRYWLQATVRRVTAGFSGPEPVLVILQEYDSKPIEWSVVLNEASPFFSL